MAWSREFESDRGKLRQIKLLRLCAPLVLWFFGLMASIVHFRLLRGATRSEWVTSPNAIS